MKRRKFVSAGAFGLSAINLPKFSFQKTNQKEPLKPFYLAPKTPLVPGPGNVDIRTIVHSKQTGGQFSNVEASVGPKQMGPSPHMHDNLDEMMYVIEGTATVMIEEDIYQVEAGGWNFRPRKMVHSFWNASDKPLRFIDFFCDQNFEDYLEKLFHTIIPEMIKNNQNPTTPEVAAKISELDKEFGVTWFHDRRQAIVEKYGLKS